MSTREFRGYSKELNEWLYGLLYEDDEGIYIYITAFGRAYKVDENSIGQFIGLFDDGGVAIYEGDILAMFSDGEGEIIGVVDFEDGCFVLKEVESDKSRLIFNPCRVVGNVYENPEFIGGKENES